MTVANLPALLQRFFTDRLLLVFASERLKRSPSRLCVEDLDTTLIGAFPLGARAQQ